MTSSGHIKFNVILSVVILGLLSSFIIFYRFNSIPKTITYDEIEFAKLALSLEKGGYIPYSPLATGHATLYFYILLYSMKLFGITSFGLRIPAAVFGVIAPILMYFILQKSIKKIEWAPFVGAFLFATTRWFFNFARFGFEGTFLLALELSSLLFFLHYMEHREKKWLIPSGIFAGLAFNSYQPGRIFFILLTVLLFFFILERKRQRPDFSIFTKYTFITFLHFLIPVVVLITPLSLYLIQNKDVRLNQLMYPVNTELSVAEKLQFFGRNVTSTTLMFSIKGDVNGRHNYPNKAALNPLMSILFIAGFILALRNLQNKINQLFIGYFFLSLFPTLLTYPWENPNMLRTITCLPSLIYFSTYALARMYEAMVRKYHIRNMLLVVGIFICVCMSALYDIRTYYVFQAPVFREAFEAKMSLLYYIENSDAKNK